MDNTDMLSSDSQPSWTSVAVKNGLILGFISAIIGLMELLTSSYGNYIFGIIGFAASVFLVVNANRDFKKQNNGFMSYGQGFKISFLTVVIAAIISGLITFFYLAVVDPAALDNIKEAKIKALEKIAGIFGASLPEEKLDEEVAKIETQTTAVSNLTEYLMGAVFGAVLLALIIPAFTKRTRPDYE
jgi:hypothetical protein